MIHHKEPIVQVTVNYKGIYGQSVGVFNEEYLWKRSTKTNAFQAINNNFDKASINTKPTRNFADDEDVHMDVQ